MGIEYNSLGWWINGFKRRKGVTTRQIADATDLTIAQVSSLLHNRRILSLAPSILRFAIFRMDDYLNANGYLLFRYDQANPAASPREEGVAS